MQEAQTHQRKSSFFLKARMSPENFLFLTSQLQQEAMQL